MCRLMGTLDIEGYGGPVSLVRRFMVAFDPYFLHQILQEDFDVLSVDAGLHHRSLIAHLAVLAEMPHLDNTLPVIQPHVEDHHHPVGRPASSTLAASEPGRVQR